MAGLTKAQQTLIEKARNPGSSKMAQALSDDACCYLAAIIARDLERVDIFPDIDWEEIPTYFDSERQKTTIHGDPLQMLGALFESVPDADTYFSCLATLHKSRLKHGQIMLRQPLPTFDQVGPRGLLQYGSFTPKALVSFLYWRKWFYDLDNRAAQDTGYLFEPILAHTIGGAPVSAGKSPIRRQGNAEKGRQVDCIRNKHAYEFKLRVTIAASGQGRWKEELDFPVDCKSSGYKPVLVVFDPTPNPKLKELASAFKTCGGSVYIGKAAWRHLHEEAGPTMAVFLQRYVRQPLAELMTYADAPPENLSIRAENGSISISVGDKTLVFPRETGDFEIEKKARPNDINDNPPGF